MAVIMDGKALAAKVKGQQREAADALKAKGITPCLAVVIVGEDPASKVYGRGENPRLCRGGNRVARARDAGNNDAGGAARIG